MEQVKKETDGTPVKEEQDQHNPSANTDGSTATSALSNTNGIVKQDPDTDSSDSEDNNEDGEDSGYQVAEPDYTKANKLSFRALCRKFETLHKQRFKKKRRSKEELLQYLILGPSHFEGGSIYPMLRLITPDRDNSRPRLWMKESTIANAWGDAIGLNRRSREFKKLTHYNNPQYNPSACGDLSMAVYDVIKQRFPETDRKDRKKGKDGNDKDKKVQGVNLGDMNKLFDILAGAREDKGSRWERESQQESSRFSQLSQLPFTQPSQASQLSPPTSLEDSSHQSSQRTAQASKTGAAKRRKKWVENLINKKFSPLEHKWIVRIILMKMDLGIGSDSIINYIHPCAQGLYNANKDLKKLCSMLCDEQYLARKQRLIQEDRDTRDKHKRNKHLPKNEEPAELYNTIDPMLSARTKFSTILSQIQKRHKDFSEELEKDNDAKSSLALRFPAFTCEVKLDGERMLTHMKRGTVKIQTRNAKWYTELYGPVIAPILRQAVHPYNVDVIIDGEMLSWDDMKKETIAFGENRGIAKLRTQWLRRHGQLDLKDTDPEKLEKENEKGMNTVPGSLFTNVGNSEYATRDDPGSDVWLKYIVFDILYLGGPDAQKVINEAFSFLDDGSKPSETGSLLDLDLMQRKRILYTLLDQEPNKLEICETVVVRSNGTSLSGQSYFTSFDKNECGYSPMVLDSVNLTIDGAVSNLVEIDRKRREGKSDQQIDQKRATACDRVYADMVSKRQLEGIVFKDLASPYMFGQSHRKHGYWLKLKEDYDARGHAADIDVVVVGGSFAVGYRNTGLLNSFMVACMDDDSTQEGVSKYLTLGYLNGNNVTDKKLRDLLATTGFFFNEQTHELSKGSWYASKEVPEFISKRSFQESSAGDYDGWRATKKHRPDLWIAPEHSFVVTVNSGEVVNSKDWSAGVSLRFPRITAVRKDGFGASTKSAKEVESVKTLHEIYYARRAQQEVGERESQSVREPITELEHSSLFATAEQTSKNGKKKRKSSSQVATPSVKAPLFNQSLPSKSDILKGKKFCILDGKYFLNEEVLDGLEAKEEGWFDEAKLIRSQQDVVNFIIQHGGECQLAANEDTDFIIGGRPEDPRVQNLRKSIEGVTAQMLNDGTKKGRHLRKIHDIGGVVKWTFLVSIVHRIQSESDGNTSEAPFRPRRNDFLVMSKFAEETLLREEDIYGLHSYLDTTMVDFKRAMMEVKKQERRERYGEDYGGTPRLKKRSKTKSQQVDQSNEGMRGTSSWQIQMNELFDESEKAILQTPRMKFINEGSNAFTSAHDQRCNLGNGMVLYPDIFPDNKFGFSRKKDTMKEDTTPRWNDVQPDFEQSEISSTLLLAKAMGAQASPHLHDGVTHILCDLKVETLEWNSRISVNAFQNVKRGELLHQKLLQMDESDPLHITLVSPEWVQSQW